MVHAAARTDTHHPPSTGVTLSSSPCIVEEDADGSCIFPNGQLQDLRSCVRLVRSDNSFSVWVMARFWVGTHVCCHLTLPLCPTLKIRTTCLKKILDKQTSLTAKTYSTGATALGVELARYLHYQTTRLLDYH